MIVSLTTSGPGKSITGQRKARQIPSLPFELLSSILWFLNNAKLNICARSSRSPYYAATPLLYRTLHIDLRAAHHPLSHPRTLLDRKVRPAISTFRRHLSAYSRLTVPPPPLLNRFTYTVHLTLTTHRRYECFLRSPPIIPLIMPNLHTLRIVPDRLGQLSKAHEHLNLCDCWHIELDEWHSTGPDRTAPRSKPCHIWEGCCYPMIEKLRPRRLILGGMITGLTCSFGDLWRAGRDSELPEWVMEVVVLAGMMSGVERGPLKDDLFLQNLPQTVEKPSIVLCPWHEAHCLIDKLESIRTRDLRTELQTMARVRRGIAQACIGEARKVELVGL
ncbi:uncharacterized protein MKK02DRAFT_43091 [Dioszegia hungarica]|uniref:F-box domain-containing protein n=1 Tax=Dioszegia hungarica TaxID=4972 RepID=A0AA38LXJ5_9TREE|nr:uncharacterized protein MKK02DRAFT_43091 [Dioszegia hungarica]KAI9638683.1 hypothetical protein MKK02DRAFT_43091 [Dioszegia hungarica]